MKSLDIFNAILAAAGVLVAFGALHRMNKKTECIIILAFVTVAIGLLGQIPAALTHSYWQPVFDTLLFGGALALMIGTRRQTIWISPDWMPTISLAVSLVAWAVFFVGLER